MGDILNLREPLDLAPGPVAEMQHIGTIDGVRVSIANQPEAHPGWVCVVVGTGPDRGCTSVLAARDNPAGHELAHTVACAIVRALDAVQPAPIAAERNAYPPKEPFDAAP